MNNTKRYIVELISTILIVVVSFIIVLLLSTITLPTGYEPFSIEAIKSQIRQITFWLTTGGMAILGIVTYSTGYNTRFIDKLTSEEATKLFAEYEATVEVKNQNYDSFKTFLHTTNIATKKDLYTQHIESKVAKYESKLDKIPYDKLSNKYFAKLYDRCTKRLNYYRAKLDPAFIDENILHLKVKGYKPVKVSYFKKNFLNTNLERNRYVSHADSRYRFSLGTKGISKVASAIVFAGITTISGITFSMSSQFWTMVSGCVFTMLMSLVSGFRFGTKIYNSEIKSVIEDRISYLQSFENWLKKNDAQYYKKVLDQAVSAEIDRRIRAKTEEQKEDKTT